MLTLDFLCEAFAGGVLFQVKVAGVRAPLIGGVVGQAERLSQRFALEEHLVFPAAKDIRSHLSRLMIDGMPEPTWGGFAAHKRPHFVHLGFASALNIHGHLVGIQRV